MLRVRNARSNNVRRGGKVEPSAERCASDVTWRFTCPQGAPYSVNQLRLDNRPEMQNVRGPFMIWRTPGLQFCCRIFTFFSDTAHLLLCRRFSGVTALPVPYMRYVWSYQSPRQAFSGLILQQLSRSPAHVATQLYYMGGPKVVISSSRGSDCINNSLQSPSAGA